MRGRSLRSTPRAHVAAPRDLLRAVNRKRCLGDRLDVERRPEGRIDGIESLLAGALRPGFDHFGVIVDLIDVQVAVLGAKTEHAIVDQELYDPAYGGILDP